MAFSLWLSLYYSVSHFHTPSLKRIIKQGRLKTQSFLSWEEAGKNLLAFLWLSLSDPHFIIQYLIFLHPAWREWLNREDLRHNLFDHDKKASKNLFAFLWLSLSDSHFIILYHIFIHPACKEWLNREDLRHSLFDQDKKANKNVFLFSTCQSFIHPVLFFVYHAPYSKAIGRLLNSLLLCIFSLNQLGFFSVYTL